MRYPNGFFLVLFILFAGVQYNDPDFAIWILIYAIPAAWAGVAAFRPGWLRQTLPTAGLGASLLVSIAGTIYMWPSQAGWWRRPPIGACATFAFPPPCWRSAIPVSASRTG